MDKAAQELADTEDRLASDLQVLNDVFVGPLRAWAPQVSVRGAQEYVECQVQAAWAACVAAHRCRACVRTAPAVLLAGFELRRAASLAVLRTWAACHAAGKEAQSV